MNDATPIDEVLELIVRKLGVTSQTDYAQFNLKDEWIRTCKKNLIFNLGTLRRLSSHRISQLHLPLLLEEELDRIIATGKHEAPLVNLQNEHTEEVRVFHMREQRFQLGLSDKQKDLLRQSWYALQALKGEGFAKFSKAFYPAFFQQNPAGQRLFQDKDLNHQSRALTSMLGWIINNLENMPHVIPVLAQMGGRHELYGVMATDYSVFASTMAQTFKKILGNSISDEGVRAWEVCINEIAGLMAEAGKKVKMGFRGHLLREKDSEKGDGTEWVHKWINLTLDTLYIFRDEAFTELAVQFSIRGIDSINILESPPPSTPHSGSSHGTNLYPFELVSSDPPFTLTLAALNERDFEDWMIEFDWRIRAIQRVFATSDDSESESESQSQSSKISSKKVLAVAKRVNRTKKKVAKKKAVETKVQVAEVFTGLSIGEKQKEAIKKTWKLLCEMEFTNADGNSQRGITMFFDEFYPKFFDVNPAAKRLFDDDGMAVQSRAMVKMMSMIMKLLDSPQDLQQIVSQLGGRHEIYGVAPADYMAFANAMCETFQLVLKKECTGEARDAWFKVLMELAAMMQSAGKNIRRQGVEGVLQRKAKGEREWKKSLIKLTLDTLFVYRDEKANKIRYTLPLGHVNSIDIVVPGSEIVIPTDHAIVIESANLQLPVFYVACETKEDCIRWVDELNWRIQAVSRVFKHDEDNSSESTSFGDTPDVKKARKNIKSLQKKKQKLKEKEKDFTNSPSNSKRSLKS